MDLETMYSDLIKLRNRLSPDGDGVIYEEDHILLDYVIDFIEKQIENAIINASDIEMRDEMEEEQLQRKKQLEKTKKYLVDLQKNTLLYEEERSHIGIVLIIINNIIDREFKK